MLTLRRIYTLYRLLGKYIGDDIDSSAGDYIGFCTTLVRKILDGGSPDDYIEAVSIVSGLDADEVVKNNPAEVFDTFLSALSESHFIEFVGLMRGLNGRA